MQVRLGLLPAFSRERQQEILRRLSTQEKPVETCLLGLFPRKMIPVLLKRAGIGKGCLAGAVPEVKWKRLLGEIRDFRVPIKETKGFAMAQVCAGGVDVREVDPLTMESRLVKGLYAAGEMLDVDGDCGGYNLQWAWTSGCLSGRAAARG